ncbi:Ankyrin-2 [Pseudocyphellaria aurata]|nr:Ankyrin-2 [Pseudocyphellaria aurata]
MYRVREAASRQAFYDVKAVKTLIKVAEDVNSLYYHGDPVLHFAAYNGERAIVELLIKAGADVNVAGEYHGSALQAAASQGGREMVKLLIKAGADVNLAGGNYGSALQAAASRGEREVVELLIKAGADVNAKGGYYGPVLQAAVLMDRKEIVELLIKSGADINFAGGYGSALQAAASRGVRNIVELLIKAGADVNAVGGFYGPALQVAALNRRKEVVELLIKSGADVNAVGGHFGSALQAAASKGRRDIVEVLIKAGADVNAVGGFYGSALQAAAFTGGKEIVEFLINAGADVNAGGGDYGSALQAAAFSGEKEIVEHLIKTGADVSAGGGKHGSALQAALTRGAAVTRKAACRDVISLLLKYPASVNLQSRGTDGTCLLHAAVTSGDLDTLNHLLKAGANELINVKNTLGQTPLQLAVMTGNLHILKALESFLKASDLLFDNPDVDGRTCLHLAVENKAVEVVEWLLERGCEADSRDLDDFTPFQRAFQVKSFEILCLLFPKSTKAAKLLSASQWRSVQPGNSKNVIVMTSGKTVETMSNQELDQHLDSMKPTKEISMSQDTPEKRMFLLAEDYDLKKFPIGLQWRWWRQTTQEGLGVFEQKWTVQSDIIPRAPILRRVSSGECFLECRLALPVLSLTLTDWGELPNSLKSSLNFLKKLHAIVWIMVKPKPPKNKPEIRRSTLESKTFFSTLEYAAVPKTPADLFVPLVQQLEEEWNDVHETADGHLSDMRTRVLQSNGTDSKLIKSLLRDARLWGILSKLLEDQIKVLRSVQGSYENNSWVLYKEGKELYKEGKNNLEHRQIREFEKETNDLSTKVQTQLGDLTATSQTLIQLEFNLTSIAEAQKSTSMNRSMKRLSWITFIFLPLTFIGTLFGMNVNILQSNPSWWIYLPFAVGITILTLIVWIAFKRSENLENRIEGKFLWLLKKKTPDEELGLEKEKSS